MIKVLKPQAYGFPDNGVLQAAADVHPRGQAPHLPDEPLLESRKIMARVSGRLRSHDRAHGEEGTMVSTIALLLDSLAARQQYLAG